MGTTECRQLRKVITERSKRSSLQLALLGGMPQAPNQYDPYSHPEAAQQRRNFIKRNARYEDHF